MNKQLTLVIFLSICTLLTKAQSQTYHAFKFDVEVGGGSSSPANPQGYTGAINFTMEPHYRLTDELSLGLRFQFAATGDTGSESSAGDYSYSSTAITADYYFNKGGFVLFGGGGLAAFTEGDNLGNYTSGLGLFPRLGFETGHFRLSFEYDVTGGAYNYTALNLGFFFGGGKK